jgi:hypothetical protein
MRQLPPPSPWHVHQMRGLGASYRRFTAHADDIAEFEALPWWKKLRYGGTNVEKWLVKRYGKVIYKGGSYERGPEIK